MSQALEKTAASQVTIAEDETAAISETEPGRHLGGAHAAPALSAGLAHDRSFCRGGQDRS